MRQMKVFKPGTYWAQFLGLTTARGGRVRLRFLVLNDETQETECVATDREFIEGTAFANDFAKTYGTTPYGLRNRGFKVKLGHTYRGLPTILNYSREDFTLPVWHREQCDKWQAAPGAKVAYLKSREKKDPKFAAANRIRLATWQSLNQGKDACDLLGCDSESLRQHIERQFAQGMNWGNYATLWEIDHTRALSSFDLTDPEEVKRAAHFSNLRPLPVAENRAKFTQPISNENAA